MKPILLYAMPRAKATACLTACKRIHQFDEPFRLDDEFVHRLPAFVNEWAQSMDTVKYNWAPFLKRLNLPDTAVKIHSRELRLPIARHWYNQVLESKSHDIYVVERLDRMQLALSYLLADHYGFWEGEKSNAAVDKIYITKADINNFERHIVQYISGFPSWGTVITFDSAPTCEFDKSLVRLSNQQSHLKVSAIANFDWCTDQLTILLAKYKEMWDAKIASLSNNAV